MNSHQYALALFPLQGFIATTGLTATWHAPVSRKESITIPVFMDMSINTKYIRLPSTLILSMSIPKRWEGLDLQSTHELPSVCAPALSHVEGLQPLSCEQPRALVLAGVIRIAGPADTLVSGRNVTMNANCGPKNYTVLVSPPEPAKNPMGLHPFMAPSSSVQHLYLGSFRPECRLY